jgi:Protein of unknown function DUF262
MRGPAQTSDPVIQYLYQLIDAIGEGKLLIPKFQRPLVWNWDRQSELLRSVKDGIPIGAIMVWRTTTERIAWQTELAGHSLPSPARGLPRDYLLDGLQRLSTLFAALRDLDFGSDPMMPIGYDLEEEAFVESFDAAAQPQVIPLRALSDSVALLRFQRKLQGDRADIWIRRADDLAKAFREYKVPVISIVSDDFDVAVRTFSLINSQGVRMGEADMIHALTWSPDFELRDQLESQRSELLQPLGWGQIEFETVLKVVKVGADLDLYDESAEQVSGLLKKDPAALGRAFEQLAGVAELLRDRCGIQNWNLVPYVLQAILLADAFRVAGPRDVRDVLADWFWITTYGEMFAGLSGHRIGVAIQDLRQTVSDGRLRWSGPSPFRVRPMPRSADFRAVRIKAVALMLARQIDNFTFGGGSETALETLSAHGRNAMFSLIPRRLLTRENFSSVGNRFLCHPAGAHELRRKVLSAELSDSERMSHVIPEDVVETARAGNWNYFVTLRRQWIVALEEAFIGELLARHPTVRPNSNVSVGG